MELCTCKGKVGNKTSLLSLDYEIAVIHVQGSCLTFSLAGQSGQPKSSLAGPQ